MTVNDPNAASNTILIFFGTCALVGWALFGGQFLIKQYMARQEFRTLGGHPMFHEEWRDRILGWIDAIRGRGYSRPAPRTVDDIVREMFGNAQVRMEEVAGRRTPGQSKLHDGIRGGWNGW